LHSAFGVFHAKFAQTDFFGVVIRWQQAKIDGQLNVIIVAETVGKYSGGCACRECKKQQKLQHGLQQTKQLKVKIFRLLLQK
jgi:hypothetical protein